MLKIISVLLALLIATPSFASGFSGTGFFVHSTELDIDPIIDGEGASDDNSNQYDTTLGFSVYYSNDYFMLNSSVISDPTEIDRRTIVRSLTISKNLNFSETEIMVSFGNVVIPFGLFQNQRIIPNLIDPVTLNSNTFSRLFSNQIISPSNTGLTAAAQRRNHSVQLGYYFPEEKTHEFTIYDDRRIYIDDDNTLTILDIDLLIPLITINISDIESSDPNQFFSQYLAEEHHELTSEKQSLFLGYTYDNRRGLHIDLEASYSIIEQISTTFEDSGSPAVDDEEIYLYAGLKKDFKRFSVITEANSFLSSSKTNSREDLAYESFLLGFSYDFYSVLLTLNHNYTTGNLLNMEETSVGAVWNVTGSLYLRGVYKIISGNYENISYFASRESCVSVDVQCRSIEEVLSRGEYRGHVTTENKEFAGDGFEFRIGFYF